MVESTKEIITGHESGFIDCAEYKPETHLEINLDKIKEMYY